MKRITARFLVSRTRAVLGPTGAVVISVGVVYFALSIAVDITGSSYAASHFPSPTQTILAGVTEISTEAFWLAIVGTCWRTLVVIMISLFLSTLIGGLLGVSERVYWKLRPTWDFFRSIPPAATFPLVVLVAGIGTEAKLLASTFFISILLSLSLADATRSVLKQYGDFYSGLRIPLGLLLLRIVTPAALVSAIPAIRVCIGLSYLIVVVTEMFLGERAGLGGRIVRLAESYDYDAMAAGILFSGVLGVMINKAGDCLVHLAARYGLTSGRDANHEKYNS